MTSPGEQGGGAGDVLVVGTGLIGTSVALGLREAGREVWLQDEDPAALRLAGELGAGRTELPRSDPAVVMVCVPPARTGLTVSELERIYVTSTFSDVASIKSKVERDIQYFGGGLFRFVGSHPLAGRERSGPGGASSDLFAGRPWVVCPNPSSGTDSVERVRRVVTDCRAQVVELDAGQHDVAVALVSHLPQITASLTAARLSGADARDLQLAGQGLRDMTRIADSDPDLWAEIVGANRRPVLAVLDALSGDLDALRAALRAQPPSDERAAAPHRGSDEVAYLDVDIEAPSEAMRSLVERGNEGRRRLPGKHGAARVEFVVVPVVVPDRPGELARLLHDAGAADVNVEDVAIEHSPGRPVGLVELSVRPDAVDRLARALEASGWSVHA